MNDFEEQLKQALSRREPASDFAERVLAIAGSQSRPAAGVRLRLWFHRTRAWRLVPVMAALLMVTGGTVYEQHQRATRGEAAKEKLLVAMRIAGFTLHRAQHRIFDVEAGEVTQ